MIHRNKLKYATAAFACLAMFHCSSHAATCTPPGTGTVTWAATGDWAGATVVSAVTGYKLPGPADVAIVNNSRTVQVTTNVDIIPGTVRISNNTVPGTLEVNSFGSLTIGSVFTMSTGSGASFLTLNGGSLTASNNLTMSSSTGASLLTIQGGSLNVIGALSAPSTVGNSATVTISSGSLTAGSLIIKAGGTMNVSGGTITVGAFTSSGTNNFTFGASGVTAVDASAGAVNLAGATINIDGTAFSGPPGTNFLVKGASFGGLPATVNISGFGPSYPSVFAAQVGNDYAVIIGTTPPPTTVYWAGGDGNWDKASTNWKTNAGPGAADTIYAAGNLVVIDDSASGTTPITVTITATNVSPGGLTVNNSTITNYTIGGNPIAGATGLTKTGGGTLTLVGTNTYTGVTTVSGGILNVSNNLALGTTAGNTVINGGAPPSGFGGSLRLPGGITLAEPLNISAGTFYAPALWSFGNNTITGLITGSGRIQTDLEGPGTLTLSGGLNSPSGTTLVGNITINTTPINAGSIITFAGTNNLKTVVNVAGNSWVLGRIAFGGTVQLGVDNALPTTSAVEFGWNTIENSAGTLDLNGHNQTVASIGNSTTAVVPAGADLRITGGGTLTVNQTTNTTFSGVISDGSTATALVKANTGTLNLTGTNTYTGNTTVNRGKLEIGVASIAANSTVNVASGATLQLDFMETNQVAGLVLNGVSQPAGVYNNSSTPTYILGSGSLQVGSATPNPATLTNSFSGGVLSLSWPPGQGWHLEYQTNALDRGLGTNWLPASDSSVSSTNITVNKTAPTVFYRLAFP